MQLAPQDVARFRETGISPVNAATVPILHPSAGVSVVTNAAPAVGISPVVSAPAVVRDPSTVADSTAVADPVSADEPPAGGVSFAAEDAEVIDVDVYEPRPSVIVFPNMPHQYAVAVSGLPSLGSAINSSVSQPYICIYKY